MRQKKIKLDRALYDQVRIWADKAGYASIDEFVTHLLEREISYLAGAEDPDILEERLRGLGYLS